MNKTAKRILSFALFCVSAASTVFVLGAVPHLDEGDVPPIAFSDVPGDAWYCSYVEQALSLGLMNGTSANRFEPDAPMTRGMVATVIYRLANSPPVMIRATPFTDVSTEDWYYDAVVWAFDDGVVTGMGDGRFAPEQLISREQMAVMMYRYAQFAGYDVSVSSLFTLSGFIDADNVSEFAGASMSWANSNNVITGKPGGFLDPKGSAARAEFAAVLIRLMELNE